MGNYQLSEIATSDISDLYADGILKYGLYQADQYYDGLVERFKFLADNPNIGTNSDNLTPNVQRFPYGRHVVFFTHRDARILIVRVLGEEMDFERHIVSDETSTGRRPPFVSQCAE